MPQVPSYIGYTNLTAHRVVKDNLERSALYGGVIQGVSARYCPSFEDKIVRFPDRDRHQIILEPEGLQTDEIYASNASIVGSIGVRMDNFGFVDAMKKLGVECKKRLDTDYESSGEAFADNLLTNADFKQGKPRGDDFAWSGKALGVR